MLVTYDDNTLSKFLLITKANQIDHYAEGVLMHNNYTVFFSKHIVRVN